MDENYMAANASCATALGSNLASVDTVASERRQIKQGWILNMKYMYEKIQKIPLYTIYPKSWGLLWRLDHRPEGMSSFMKDWSSPWKAELHHDRRGSIRRAELYPGELGSTIWKDEGLALWKAHLHSKGLNSNQKAELFILKAELHALWRVQLHSEG